MVDEQTPKDTNTHNRAAAAYLDMWEDVASEHALNGPQSDGVKPDGAKPDGAPRQRRPKPTASDDE